MCIFIPNHREIHSNKTKQYDFGCIALCCESYEYTRSPRRQECWYSCTMCTNYKTEGIALFDCCMVSESTPLISVGWDGNYCSRSTLNFLHFVGPILDVIRIVIPRGGHSIVKLNTTCVKTKSIFSKLHHRNRSKLYQYFS